MIRRLTVQIGLLGLAFALATFLFGWWAVAVLACVWGLYDRLENRPALVAAFAAAAGWGLLLLWTATRGPLLELASRVSGVLGVPAVSFIGLTLVFPMVLAWGAGELGGTVRFLWKRRKMRM